MLNCTDEKIGFYHGIRYLAEHGYIRGTTFSRDYSIESIILTGSAGDLDIEVKTVGRSSHSGLSILKYVKVKTFLAFQTLKLRKNAI